MIMSKTKRVIAFYVIAAICACAGIGLLILAHIDLVALRQSRGGFNFDGLVAFLACLLFLGGTVVLFILWRLLVFAPETAVRDLRIWIWYLIGLKLFLHVPFLHSFIVEQRAFMPQPAGYWDGILAAFGSQDTIVLLPVLFWPLPALYFLWWYRVRLMSNSMFI